MINETKRNIEAYKALLPGLKERVAAVALMLVMSVVMMTSATYAWLTISRAPEVQGMNTTITGNGNLEIALVGSVWDEAAKEYVIAQIGESAIGDSAATDGKDIMDANIAWGNLINLSDSRYGLSNIMLRPALLSSFNLMKEPLYGVVYSDDGRIEGYSDKYGVGSWTDPGNGKYYFAAGSALRYGVRAIGIMEGSTANADVKAERMEAEAEEARKNVVTMYQKIIRGETMVDEARGVSCMDALTMLVEIYANEVAKNATVEGYPYLHDFSSVVTYTYRLTQEFMKVMEAEREALRLIANWQAYKLGKGENCFPTPESLTSANLKTYGVTLSAFSTHLTDYNNLVGILTKEDSAISADKLNHTPSDGIADYASLKTLATLHDPDNDLSTDAVHFESFKTDLEKLVNISTTTVNNIAIQSISASNAVGLVTASNFDIVIKGGAIQRFEKRVGAIMADEVKPENGGRPVTISLTIKNLPLVGDKKIQNAKITTSAAQPYYIISDMNNTTNLQTKGDAADASWSIGDTYGLALDFWVRTNGDDVNLILEGKVLYETVDATISDKNGKETVLYTLTLEEDTLDAYKLAGTEDWYDAYSHSKLGTESELKNAGYTFEKQTKEVVVGFRGENRVWEDWEDKLASGLISENSTTQGAGSCYVFYAQNETDQVRILKLLESLVISFVDQDGSKLADAALDTENAYTINGKVTVPLKLVTGTRYEDKDGNMQYAITSLVKNQATWISAIVYLDGTKLTNQEVLSVGEIEGSLNLQFGSDVDLNGAKDDEKLGQIYRTFSATAVAGGKQLGFVDDNTKVKFDYSSAGQKATVTLLVEGEQPANITGFFTRLISQSQGSRTDTMEFTKQDNGTWTATFDISKPGTYSFKTIRADGVDYTLENCPIFEITGMKVTSAEVTNVAAGITMTSDGYKNVNVSVGIDVDPALMPSNVRAQFRSTDGSKEFNAILSQKNGQWEGTARITSSGTYELKYVTIDGLEWNMNPTEQYVFYLGVTASVTTDAATEFPFEGETVDADLELELFYDDNGTQKELENWTGVTLSYANSGSDAPDDGHEMNVTWNATKGCYTAVLGVDAAGIFQFAKVTIVSNASTNQIYTATEAPVFTAIPKAPPQYDSFTPAAYQFAPNKDASMTVAMYYAQAADVWALMVHKTDASKTQLVKCTGTKVRYGGDPAIDPDDTNYYDFTFDMPGDGDWQITKLCFQKVYVDGTLYGTTETAPTAQDYSSCYVIDVTDEEINTYVVETIKVTTTVNGAGYDNSQTIVFGNQENTAFMTSHNIENVVFTVTDWAGAAVPLDALLCQITHDSSTTVACGGYTANQKVDIPAVTLTANGNRTVFSAATTSIHVAGEYTVGLYYTYNGQTYTLATVRYKVLSVAPTVTLTSAYTATASDGGSGTTLSNPGNSVTVYFVKTTNTTCGITTTNYTSPYVKIRLMDIGNANNATLQFVESSGGTVRLYSTGGSGKSNSDQAQFTWTADGECTRYVGDYKYQSGGSDSKTPAGTLTATSLVLTYNGETYTVTLPDSITISNPN